MNPKVSEDKQIFLYVSMFFGTFVSFQKKKLNLCIFPISYPCLHVISYKCKYVLFHLNMLRLFQEINILFFFDIKLVSNKISSLKHLIQGFNPLLLSWFNVYPP
jgi:hypothetical protein